MTQCQCVVAGDVIVKVQKETDSVPQEAMCQIKLKSPAAGIGGKMILLF